jgi:hypothetical protein
MGYHKKDIPRGKYGHFSKIKEEFVELEDAWEQDDLVLQLCELADLYGAIEQYVWRKFDMEMEDIKKFSDKTKEAFKDGSR